MAPEIRRIDDATWSFEEPGVRFFLLTGREKALLIDSGMQTRSARELAQTLTDLPLFLLNTHADPDHLGSCGQFDTFYMHPAEASNYYHSHGGKGRFTPVWDGDVLDLGDRPLRIIEIPGHTPGSIAILDVKHRRLFAGDTVQNGHIFLFGIQRELHAYRQSLLRLQEYAEAFDTIYPSHAGCPVKPALIMELYDAAGRILDGAVDGKPGEMHGKPITVYEPGPAVFLCDAKEPAAAPSLLELMQNRRSVRAYTDQPVPADKLEKILQAGLLSPSGKNTRPWAFIVVRDRETLRRMAECRVGSAKMLSGAACAIVVLGDEEKTDTVIEDCSIALAQMHLMAASLGLGSCWIQGRLRQAPDGRTTEDYLRALLGFPASMRLEAILSVGVPAQKPAPHEAPDIHGGNVHWERF